MAIRQPAAEKLVRQLLELRLTRVNKLTDKFITAMAKIVITHVDMDEQRQRSEKLNGPQPESKEPRMSTSRDGPPTAAVSTEEKK